MTPPKNRAFPSLRPAVWFSIPGPWIFLHGLRPEFLLCGASSLRLPVVQPLAGEVPAETGVVAGFFFVFPGEQAD